MFAHRKLPLSVMPLFLFTTSAFAQSTPNVSQVIAWSTLTTRPLSSVDAGGVVWQPTAGGVNIPAGTFLPLSPLSVYSTQTSQLSPTNVGAADNFRIAVTDLSSVLSTNIATVLSVMPMESPTSGVILKTDPVTGAALPVTNTLGPIFTKRAETIGKGNFYVGFSHQDYHFSSINGLSLNGLRVLDPGGQSTNLGLQTSPMTLDLGVDVRLSQNVAFLTYGLTDKIDISLGLPMVHAAVASRSYNGIIYSGDGLAGGSRGANAAADGSNCWCVNTFAPGSFQLTAPSVGQSSMGKTGYGDTLVRFKSTVLERPNAVFAAGIDLRFPTGDASNYLGIGTTAAKPFVALSLYSRPLAKGIVLAPHMDFGWQFAGKSVLGGTLSSTPQTLRIGTSSITYPGVPFQTGKGYIPDVLAWSVGTEVAFGRRNTLLFDILGNQIGLAHGIPSIPVSSVSGVRLPGPAAGIEGPKTTATGIISTGKKTSIAQYSGAFGYKARLMGNLVATLQFMVRFNDAGLKANVVPLYGLGYSF